MGKLIMLMVLVAVIWFALRLGGAANKAKRKFEDQVNDYMGSENRSEYIHRTRGTGRARGGSEKDITDQVRILDENDGPKSGSDRK